MCYPLFVSKDRMAQINFIKKTDTELCILLLSSPKRLCLVGVRFYQRNIVDMFYNADLRGQGQYPYNRLNALLRFYSKELCFERAQFDLWYIQI